MMKLAIILAGTGWACALGLQAAAAQPARCEASLQQATAAWNAIGYATPSKPLQAVVVGRSGQVSSGAEVTYLSNQIRLAAQDCAAGRDDAALQHIAAIHARLSPSAR